jgi:hypothetical protein
VIRNGDIRDERRLARRLPSQMNHGLQPIFAFFREHANSVGDFRAQARALPIDSLTGDMKPFG